MGVILRRGTQSEALQTPEKSERKNKYTYQLASCCEIILLKMAEEVKYDARGRKENKPGATEIFFGKFCNPWR